MGWDTSVTYIHRKFNVIKVGWNSSMIYRHRNFSETKAKRIDTYLLLAFCCGMDVLVDDVSFI